MTMEIPAYGLRAYALLFTKYGTQRTFMQSELDWIVSISMKKKIFALLLRSGWICKQGDRTYSCIPPAEVIKGLLTFRVPTMMQQTTKPYAFTQLSAVEIWSDFSYVQRGLEKSPYFIKVLPPDLSFWKDFFHAQGIPTYISSGTTIGEFVILIPVSPLSFVAKDGFKVDSLPTTRAYAQAQDIYAYAYAYMTQKYGAVAWPLIYFPYESKKYFIPFAALRDCNFVLIGGYAVNAYTLPRFSVDCDIVLHQKRELERIEKILFKRGYHKQQLSAQIPYTGTFFRYEKSIENDFRVSMDILVGAVTDRMTGAVFLAEWIFKNSRKHILSGKTITEHISLRIISLDALLVLKMISCRSTDIWDVFLLFVHAQDKAWIRSEICSRCDFQERLSKIIATITLPQFRDGLAGVYGKFDTKIFEKHQQALLQFASATK